jgi:type IV secretory pathway TrbL component
MIPRRRRRKFSKVEMFFINLTFDLSMLAAVGLLVFAGWLVWGAFK